ncbi:MAG: hypothetical protein K6T68_08115 [Alicyclobacillus shizuokensis]|nr:hypothetical protein [Alicyclobacillus shizuokensis]
MHAADRMRDIHGSHAAVDDAPSGWRIYREDTINQVTEPNKHQQKILNALGVKL